MLKSPQIIHAEAGGSDARELGKERRPEFRDRGGIDIGEVGEIDDSGGKVDRQSVNVDIVGDEIESRTRPSGQNSTRSTVKRLKTKGVCCGDSRGYRAQTMRENKSSGTKTRTQNKGQPKALSTVDFSKGRSPLQVSFISFYREADGFFYIPRTPSCKTNQNRMC
jgi:hypothetical protein